MMAEKKSQEAYVWYVHPTLQCCHDMLYMLHLVLCTLVCLLSACCRIPFMQIRVHCVRSILQWLCYPADTVFVTAALELGSLGHVTYIA